VNYCPITYEPCSDRLYSSAGLRSLSPNLQELNDFPYHAEQQRREAAIRAGKMSIQGIQPKLSALLNAKGGEFEIADQGGRYIIKPQQGTYPNLPENEGLTMHMAGLCGIEVPVNGLVRCADRSWSYFIRRFDREGHKRKVPLEDFAQLAGRSRDTKYDFSMERLVKVIDEYCTFPMVEKMRLFRRSLFNFLVGNEDMHLKNFSLITRKGKVELAPAYDYLSTTVAFLAFGKRIDTIEEVALPLRGKKRSLTRDTWIDYFGRDRLALPAKINDGVLEDLAEAGPVWHERIGLSFLPSDQKLSYKELLSDRFYTLGLS
jgi:serine/threonine-protein kinase HipA